MVMARIRVGVISILLYRYMPNIVPDILLEPHNIRYTPNQFDRNKSHGFQPCNLRHHMRDNIYPSLPALPAPFMQIAVKRKTVIVLKEIQKR